MSDEIEAVETDEATEDRDPAWYRDQLAKKDKKIAEQEGQINTQRVRLMERTFKDVGLDPTTGLGKAIAKEYQGEPDPEALRNYAVEEYNWEPPAESAPNPIGAEIAQAQARVSQAMTSAEASPANPIDLQIADAEKRGDFASSITLKMQKFRQEQGI